MFFSLAIALRLLKQRTLFHTCLGPSELKEEDLIVSTVFSWDFLSCYVKYWFSKADCCSDSLWFWSFIRGSNCKAITKTDSGWKIVCCCWMWAQAYNSVDSASSNLAQSLVKYSRQLFIYLLLCCKARITLGIGAVWWMAMANLKSFHVSLIAKNLFGNV